MFYHDGLRITAAENARYSSIFRATPSDHCYAYERFYRFTEANALLQVLRCPLQGSVQDDEIYSFQVSTRLSLRYFQYLLSR
ncbi:hypothetical protein NEOLEDRAFT_1127633 [Neolentinus lepideus HHB14362 ss-1]|uniref:Uncharacterized protein n=1 Tax=Neolentinus lepideus HHB14362 ss-1 TaxID=1314782 RepID=A0A165VK67_9AGAM|nr:hypothetical protein NEOLEDRAFT_1127633 [Neolentinus lepideus HHB14362 ss-1]